MTVDRTAIDTPFGAIAYAERGAGEPLSHGLPPTAADARTVTGLAGTFFPVVPRAEG